MAFPRRTFQGISELLNSMNTKIQSTLLPSGAIVWFKRQTAPTGWAVCDGTNGTPNLIGRYPLGATSNIGSTVKAGLPNITGSIMRIHHAEGVDPLGAFYDLTDTAAGEYMSSSYGHNGRTGFDASRCNPIYGKSDTVTPPSVKLLPCMKL